MCLGVFSGFSETENGKSKYIFGFRGLQGLPVWLSLGGGGRVHWVQVVQAFEASGPAGCWRWSSGRVFPAFLPAVCLLVCFVPDVLGLNMLLFGVLRRFLAGFRARMYICMG